MSGAIRNGVLVVSTLVVIGMACDGIPTPLPTHLLEVTVQGEGQVWKVTPQGNVPFTSDFFTEGTVVTLLVTPAPGWVMHRWDGAWPISADNPLTMTMRDSDKKLTAILLQAEAFFSFDTDAAFAQGRAIGVERDPAGTGLRLSDRPTTFPYIWVPNSNEGTISKVDTTSGRELGRYRVCPATVTGNPSRTTIDLQGNCYVANRNSGTMVKVGLFENGGYEDRNGNGTIETSEDTNGDGDITGSELLPWGEDECVLYEVVLVGAAKGVYAPGTYSGTYPNNYYNPGTRSIAVDGTNNVWVGAYGTRKLWYVNGTTGSVSKEVDVSSVNHTPYGGVIDQNGILWSSGQDKNHVLWLNPQDDTYGAVAVSHFAYGLGIDRSNHLFVSGGDSPKLSRVDVTTKVEEWSKSATRASGLAVTEDGDVWTADHAANTVTRWSNQGELKATIAVGKVPKGVAVDAVGKVWVVDDGDALIHRINPATNQVDLSKAVVGTAHYGYSDMTGIVARTVSTRIGTWTATHDSGDPNTNWRGVRWNGQQPVGTRVAARVRSSADQQHWASWEQAPNGPDLFTTPPARYLQVELTLQIESGQASPIVEWLGILTRD
jgi:hypothetical protein